MTDPYWHHQGYTDLLNPTDGGHPMPAQPAAAVDQIGPNHSPRFELSLWDAEERDYVHAAMLEPAEALAVLAELPPVLAAAGIDPGRSQLYQLAAQVRALSATQAGLHLTATHDGRESAAAHHSGQMEALRDVLKLIAQAHR